MSRIASLGMYDFPWLRDAIEALWAAIAGRLAGAGIADVPAGLDRDRPPEAAWTDPRLLLGQTCGYPLVTTLRDSVQVVATPCYDLPGCAGFWHRSFVIVRDDDTVSKLSDLRGRRCAFNAPDSNTGMNLLRATLASLPDGRDFVTDLVRTGAHLESIRAVQEARADFAAVDCVTYGLTLRDRPDLAGETRVLAWTPGSPALPLITGRGTTAPELETIRGIITDPNLAPLWRPLGVSRVVATSFATYKPVEALASIAAEAGI